MLGSFNPAEGLHEYAMPPDAEMVAGVPEQTDWSALTVIDGSGLTEIVVDAVLLQLLPSVPITT